MWAVMKMFEQQSVMKMDECCYSPSTPNDIGKGRKEQNDQQKKAPLR